MTQSTGYMWLGWYANTEKTTFSVLNGAIAQFNTVGGLVIQQGGSQAKIVVDNGTIKAAGNREGQFGGYKTNGWLVGWDGTKDTVNIQWGGTGDNWTYITSIPEPATIALLGLGAMTLLRRNKK